MPESSFAKQSPINLANFKIYQVPAVMPSAATMPVQPMNNPSSQGMSSFNLWDIYIYIYNTVIDKTFYIVTQLCFDFCCS